MICSAPIIECSHFFHFIFVGATNSLVVYKCLPFTSFHPFFLCLSLFLIDIAMYISVDYYDCQACFHQLIFLLTSIWYILRWRPRCLLYKSYVVGERVSAAMIGAGVFLRYPLHFCLNNIISASPSVFRGHRSERGFLATPRRLCWATGSVRHLTTAGSGI